MNITKKSPEIKQIFYRNSINSKISSQLDTFSNWSGICSNKKSWDVDNIFQAPHFESIVYKRYTIFKYCNT